MNEIEGTKAFNVKAFCADYNLDYFQGSVLENVFEYKKTRELSYIQKAVDVCSFCIAEARVNRNNVKPVIKDLELENSSIIMRLLNRHFDTYLAQALYKALCNNYDSCEYYLVLFANAIRTNRNDNEYIYSNGAYTYTRHGYGVEVSITPTFEHTRLMGHKIYVSTMELDGAEARSYYAPIIVKTLDEAKSYASELIKIQEDYINGLEDGVVECDGSEFGILDCAKCEYRKFGNHVVVMAYVESIPGAIKVQHMVWSTDTGKYEVRSGVGSLNYDEQKEYFDRWYNDIYEERVILEVSRKYKGILL